MENNKFWIKVDLIIAAVIISLIVSITTYNIYNNVMIARAIKAGVNPIAAKCALDTPGDRGILLCANFLNK
jgi:hypothetical protein